jgi:Uma2 family endonuclease
MIVSRARGGMLGHDHLSTASRAEHIMAMPAFKRWTAREVRQLIAENPLATPRYELVDGELLVTPSPNALHQDAVYLLLRALNDYLKRNPVGYAYTSPFDVELEPESVLQPDVFVVPMHEKRRLRHEMPGRELLVGAEVLSPSSGRYDRVTKRRLYQRHVAEYWIVDLDARLVERWQPNEERPEVLVATLLWSPASATETFRLDLPGYFAEILDE